MHSDEGPLPLRELEVLPFPGPSRDVLDDVMRGLSRRIAVPCRLRLSAPDVEVATIPGRNQADADRLLASLEALASGAGRLLVGVTTRDIGHPIFTHFFGRARHFGRALLVSCARLDPSFYGLPEDPRVTARRIVLEILHELGHVVGLGHCREFACLMRFAASVEAIDNRGASFCRACGAGLPEELASLRSS